MPTLLQLFSTHARLCHKAAGALMAAVCQAWCWVAVFSASVDLLLTWCPAWCQSLRLASTFLEEPGVPCASSFTKTGVWRLLQGRQIHLLTASTRQWPTHQATRVTLGDNQLASWSSLQQLAQQCDCVICRGALCGLSFGLKRGFCLQQQNALLLLLHASLEPRPTE
jgi:hypothetical protein